LKLPRPSLQVVADLKYNFFAHRIEKNPVFEFIGQGQKRSRTGAVTDPDHLRIKILHAIDLEKTERSDSSIRQSSIIIRHSIY
jgi:hypothetical protein